MIKRIGPQERIFKELQLIENTAFQFAPEQSAVDNVERLCEAMQVYPPEDYIIGGNLLLEYNEDVSTLRISFPQCYCFKDDLDTIHNIGEGPLKLLLTI